MVPSYDMIANENIPVPTIVQTLVSPISTCQRAPDAAPASLDEPRRPDVIDPAELGRLRPLGAAFFVTPPALDVARFFLTRPPSLDKKSDIADEGDAGALSTCPKYSLPVDETGVDEIGEPGIAGEFEPAPWALFH